MRERSLRIGDMVDFRSPFFGATTEKKRPGIIIEIEKKEVEHREYLNNQTYCTVLWANGRRTSEFYSILDHFESIPNFSGE